MLQTPDSKSWNIDMTCAFVELKCNVEQNPEC